MSRLPGVGVRVDHEDVLGVVHPAGTRKGSQRRLGLKETHVQHVFAGALLLLKDDVLEQVRKVVVQVDRLALKGLQRFDVVGHGGRHRVERHDVVDLPKLCLEFSAPKR